MEKRPINTLFMLMSLDGKINSGDSDELDVDRDWCKIDGVKEGLHQYYDIVSEICFRKITVQNISLLYSSE